MALDESLRNRIIERSDEDQNARSKCVEAMKGSILTKIDDAIVQEALAVDRANNGFVKEVIQTYGWPGNALVGEEGAAAFWLLVQHQDLDVPLQVEGLALLKAAVEKGDALPRQLAYLTDRVNKNLGVPQVYGTQWVMENDKMKSYQIEDVEGLEQRRAAMGLPTMAEYREELIKGYKLSEDAFE